MRGSILIITLLVISILVVAATETMRRMQVEKASAAVYTGTVQGRVLARSGQSLAQYLLADDLLQDTEDEADHYGEAWALQHQNRLDLPLLSDQNLNASVIDEQGKFPINSLVAENGSWSEPHRQTLVNLLGNRPFSLSQEKVEELMPRIKDWLDTDSRPSGVHGAENDTYALEGSSAACRNGPLLFATELLHIKGMPRRIFEQADNQPKLQDLITVHTRGAININTARPEILAAMVNPDVARETAREFASAMLDYRRDPMHFDFLSETDWYRNRMAGYNDIQLPAGIVTTSSNMFALLLEAQIGQVRTSWYAVLEREPAKDQVVFHVLHTETD